MTNTVKNIVKDINTNQFKIIESSGGTPFNSVLRCPLFNDYNGSRYVIVKHDLSVVWYYGNRHGNVLIFEKDGIELLKKINPTMQVALEYLNKFESMTCEEFDKYEEKALKKIRNKVEND